MASLKSYLIKTSLLHSRRTVSCSAAVHINICKTVKEQPTLIKGTVKGSVPSWLSGRLLRNGPGMFEVGDTKYNHWFDGLALLHSFTIDDGKVSYRSRFLQSQSYKKNMAANRIVVSEFGTVAHPDPCKTVFQRIASYFSQLSPDNMSDNDLVNVYPVGGGFVAATETDIVHSFDPETLETKERLKFSKNVAVNMATAHAHYEPDGTTYNLGNSFKASAHYNIIRIPPPKKTGTVVSDQQQLLKGAEVLCSIPSKWKSRPGYYHSFGMTKNHFAFLEQPLIFDIPGLLRSQLLGGKVPTQKFLKHLPDEKTQFHVVDRETQEVVKTKYWAEPFFVFHHINTFEDDDHLVMDMCCYDDPDAYACVPVNNLLNGSYAKLIEALKPSVRRYVLPLNLSKRPQGENLVTLDHTSAKAVLQTDGTVLCDYDKISPTGFDLPQINYGSYNGKKYYYAYGLSIDWTALVKLDITTKAVKFWQEEDCYPSEPVFAARPGAQGEDDGVLLSAVLNSVQGRAPFLLVLDARSMEEVGRAEFPGIEMHKDFHGIFVPANV